MSNSDDMSPEPLEDGLPHSTGTNGSAGFAATTTTDAHSSNHQRQKRARSQLSCTPCRQGKLKCNRQHTPACDQCIKRNRESVCVYVPPPVKQKPAQNVKGRIRQLENLVVDLMNQNRRQGEQSNGAADGGSDGDARHARSKSRDLEPFAEPTPPSDNDAGPALAEQSQNNSESPLSDVDGATAPFGKMRISKDEISYVGDSHWGAILHSISDLKRDLDDVDEEEAAEGDDPDGEEHQAADGRWTGMADSASKSMPLPFGGRSGLGFILNSDGRVTKEQLIKSVPDKKTTDRLLSLWFNSPDPFKPIIHAPTFQDEYRRFCRNPNETPVMWLGLLFAIMSIAASFGLRDNDPASPQGRLVLQEACKYHGLAASAAVLADFTRPKQHTLECLMLYTAGLRSDNAFVNVWLMTGLTVRLALRMGYHRDPSHYPAISPFQGEMRRRCWALISMIDVLISFQLGLPSIIKTVQSDTQPPRNLLDRDLNADTKVLPQSRTIDELTPSSYTRVKLKIVRVFANAAEMSHATILPSHETTMRLDRELEEAKANIPPLLRMPDISELVTDPAEQLMCRFNLDLLYLKTKLVLHRHFMLTPHDQLSPEEQQEGIGHSRKVCIEAALRVLHHHQTIYTASQNGGQLESVKWYMGSISTHDFLLAAMVICLELSYQIKDPRRAGDPKTGAVCKRRVELMRSLERSSHIWSSASGRKRQKMQFTVKEGLEKGEHIYDETEKASRAMAVMLEKMKAQFGEQTAQRSMASGPNGFEASPAQLQSSAARPNGAPSQGPPRIHNFPVPVDNNTPFNGLVSNFQWGPVDDLDGNPFVSPASVPSTVNSNASLSFSNSSPMQQGGGGSDSSLDSSLGGTPGKDRGGNFTDAGGDFAMIGDMLDVPVNLDWEMWDNEINKPADGVFGSEGNAFDPAAASELNGGFDFNMRYGNAVVGGSGPVRQLRASSSTDNNSFAPTAGTEGLDYEETPGLGGAGGGELASYGFNMDVNALNFDMSGDGL